MFINTSLYSNLIVGRYLYVLKGLPNGVEHEKNGNKRPHEDDRLLILIYFLIFFVFSFFLISKCLLLLFDEFYLRTLVMPFVIISKWACNLLLLMDERCKLGLSGRIGNGSKVKTSHLYVWLEWIGLTHLCPFFCFSSLVN